MGVPDRKWAKRLLDNTSRGLLGMHVFMAFYYVTWSVLPMFCVNAACALINVIGLLLMRRGMTRTQIFLLYLSEFAHIAASVILLGWSAGFLVPLVGLTSMIFLAEFLGRLLKLPYMRALPFGLVNLALYVLAFPRCFHQAGLLAFSQSSVYVIQLVWSGCVFALLTMGMHAVMYLTTLSQHSLSSKAETDELTGLIGAAALMRPTGISDMETKSVMKKFKDKKFAAGCSRDVIRRGAEMLGMELGELIELTLNAMRA